MSEYRKAVLKNVTACFSVASILRKTLGPSGRDKMLVFPDGSVFISNDGAFILKQLDVQHPAAMVLVNYFGTDF
jgi:chaperonin GroEL (HSP60 family)